VNFNFPSADRIIGLAMAEALRPAEAMTPSEWAAANLIVPDGERAGQKFDLRLAPYLAEPLDFLGPDSGLNEIAVMKSAQTGFTTMLIAAVGHSISCDPCRMMVLQPTDAALSGFNREKLQPAFDATPALKTRVVPQTSRSAIGSTMYSKKFAGGSLTMAIASSAAALRSKTIKKLFRDEIDEYPEDLDGQGSPLALSDARLLSFLTQGDWKKLDISTPTIKGASKIERRYEAGDRRRWNVRCPGCGDEFVFEWGAQFRHERSYPFAAHYVAPCCGSIVEAHEKNELVRKGRWIAGAPRPGAYPSYHFDALSSPFVPWSKVAEAFITAGDDPVQVKSFYNLWLGLPYEIRGDAPDHVRLMERREDGFTRGHIPARGLILVAAADVQMRGIWVEVIAIARNRETFVVDALYLDGSTEAPDGEAFEQLTGLLDRQWPDAFGRTRTLDALGCDSGYRSHVVYAWVRANRRIAPLTNRMDATLALKGVDGWHKPSIGTPSLVDVDLLGRRQHKGVRVWPVGTWSLKGTFYEDLRKEGRRSGKAADPEGYCHFPSWLDETYFRQLVSEDLVEEVYRGRARKFWKLRSSERDNHFLDCRVYNMALADHLRLSALTPEDWSELERQRGAPAAGEALLPAQAVPDLAPTLEARPAPERGVSEEQIARIQRAVEARGAEAARAWPPRRNACQTN
jgi:phage terminase large subunit GpA-like protein